MGGLAKFAGTESRAGRGAGPSPSSLLPCRLTSKRRSESARKRKSAAKLEKRATNSKKNALKRSVGLLVGRTMDWISGSSKLQYNHKRSMQVHMYVRKSARRKFSCRGTTSCALQALVGERSAAAHVAAAAAAQVWGVGVWANLYICINI